MNNNTHRLEYLKGAVATALDLVDAGLVCYGRQILREALASLAAEQQIVRQKLVARYALDRGVDEASAVMAPNGSIWLVHSTVHPDGQ